MTIFEDAKKYIHNAAHLDGCGVYGDGPQDCTCGLDALQALRSLPTDDGWEDIATLPEDLPIGTNALFWGVAHVSGSWLEDEQRYQRWITERKIFKWAYVGRDHGRGPNGSANLENWYEPSNNGACRVDKLEATKWRPLPAPPSD